MYNKNFETISDFVRWADDTYRTAMFAKAGFLISAEYARDTNTKACELYPDTLVLWRYTDIDGLVREMHIFRNGVKIGYLHIDERDYYTSISGVREPIEIVSYSHSQTDSRRFNAILRAYIEH